MTDTSTVAVGVKPRARYQRYYSSLECGSIVLWL